MDLMLNTKSTAIYLCKEEILTRRRAAKRGMDEAADNMKEYTSKRLKTLTVGESCKIRIPEVFRDRGDLVNVMVCFVDIDAKGMMSLGSKFGIFEGRYTRAELVPCGESFINIDNIPGSRISVHELAREDSNGTGQVFF